ncbi:MAG TPA: nuclear transport factor 2 family protein [Dokdonella sp.]|uniref:nuclear transport factor 2 family protein n=1 Tax=Dokdonella sp. TaxID=2291710 RepID=UPI002BBAE896|nr:nuclear transport factor 2 family protein [Dokdonella sp.]HUD43331.1 nuclear transport factor 2 family protein [Dokdonella sp.]
MRNRGWGRTPLRWCTAAWLILALAACSRGDDETRLRQALERIETAVEERRPGDFVDVVSEDFTGADGTLDRAGLHNLLRAQVVRHASIDVVLAAPDIEIQGDRATVAVTATLSGGAGGWLPERGAVYAITSGWRREDGQWRCINAQWRQVL